ncbi:hypothetical protein [Mycolicibacterium fortuitum]|uniref:Uncharacterized protein n=1 Tax=Mycolicibacterium fortuitum TaxID=1766 RepID=A0AAE4V6P8_MYCFO|nr:hypothetical protein [Mycolicibacterium fortuitum]MDV7194624.1 hypothetical protein [Mycolicibacterium fortuitum]MDV7208624.1 hypothetical protein [Mycolicibacterium fortuitum]MDV7230521.1 hypothetical protein [Mycolicibacterium fortuitum]MDV7261872.1 hypothetical protein [Mycolicibacterium fortuitum]MDV7287019.1 hypothetical protein [Mycolicibacterium fortuitum]
MNQAVVDLIARTLPMGLPHPGDENTPSRIVPLPGFRSTGMSDEQAQEFIGQAAKTVAEALVHLIEGEYEILTKADAAQLRQDAADAPDGTRIVTLHCGNTNNPALLQLTVGKTDQVVVPAAALKALKGS